MIYISLLLVFLVSYSFYFIGKKRALNITTQRDQTLSALPDYYGYYSVIIILVPAILIWFFLLIFKSNFQEIYVMSPFLFPDIDTWSASKTGLIMNKITNLSYIVNLPDIDLSVGDKSILKMASDSELIAAKNLASFDKIYGWANITLFIILPILNYLTHNPHIFPSHTLPPKLSSLSLYPSLSLSRPLPPPPACS